MFRIRSDVMVFPLSLFVNVESGCGKNDAKFTASAFPSVSATEYHSLNTPCVKLGSDSTCTILKATAPAKSDLNFISGPNGIPSITISSGVSGICMTVSWTVLTSFDDFPETEATLVSFTFLITPFTIPLTRSSSR